MRILIDMGHPAHVHLFKNFIWEMEKRGHEIKVTARDKEVTKNLLDAYKIPYELVGKMQKGRLNLYREWIGRGLKIFKIGRKLDADIYIGMANPATAIAARLNRKTSITFTDTEHAMIANMITFPITDIILTPDCYLRNLGKKQIRYNGYHELAYLHPNYFTPNPEVLDEVGLTPGERFIIMRFVSWQASHDVGQHGIIDHVGLVKMLEPYGRLLITSEGPLPPELEQYRIRVSPDKLHDLLYYATLCVGEGATIASECAVLGTPAIYVNTLKLGYIGEEDKKYHLVSDFSVRTCTDATIIEEAKRLLENKNLKLEGRRKRERIQQEKCDVTAFMMWFIENNPKSLGQLKDHPEIQLKFW